jgi:ubiquinone/menaquinone biosynthesis C-methylase UbiE
MTTHHAHGRLIQGTFRYDLKMWTRSLGREGAFRRELVDLARLSDGDDVLDLGCGTGSLALAAKRRVGAGQVHGIDPSAEMIDAARRKARRRRLDVSFEVGIAQELRLADASVDAVLATLVLHHLPHDALVQSLREVKRVLRPGGRFLAVDLDLSHPDNPRGSPHAHAHRIGAHFDLDDTAALATHLGFEIAESGPVAFKLVRFERMRYVLATA